MKRLVWWFSFIRWFGQRVSLYVDPVISVVCFFKMDDEDCKVRVVNDYRVESCDLNRRFVSHDCLIPSPNRVKGSCGSS